MNAKENLLDGPMQDKANKTIERALKSLPVHMEEDLSSEIESFKLSSLKMSFMDSDLSGFLSNRNIDDS